VQRRSALGLSACAALGAALTLSAACNTQPLRARRVTAATAAYDLFGGSDATGGVGDWELTNGLLEAIVDDVDYQADVVAATGQKVPINTYNATSGGMLVDLALYHENNDQLPLLYPVFNYNAAIPMKAIPASEELHDPSLGALVPAVDNTTGEASLTAYGRILVVPGVALADQPLAFQQKYILRRGERFLRIRTEVKNTDPSATYTVDAIADAMLLGPGGPVPFVPYPGRGFNLSAVDASVPFASVFGLLGPSAGPVHESGAATGEVSYTFAAPDNARGPFVVSHSSDGVAVVGSIPLPTLLAPDESWSFERRIYVGRRGDVASSAEPALNDFSAQAALPVGSFTGQIVTADGSPFRASVEITQIDLSPGTPQPETIATPMGGGSAPMPLLQIRTDQVLSGGFASNLPAGLYELRIKAEERNPIGPIPFTVQAGIRTDVGTFTLSDNGTLLFEVLDQNSGALIPARITVKGKNGPDPNLGLPVDLYDAGVAQNVGSRATVPYGNTIYAPTGDGQVRLKPGSYRVIASHGPEYNMAWQDVVIGAAGAASVSLQIQHQVDTSGWLGADFHVHASPSADSSVPPRDRVASLLGEGVEVMVSADHDMIFDYAPVIATMQVGSWLRSIVGTELTSNQGPAPFGNGVGHFNGWPLPLDPTARKNGTPEDDGVEPNVLYDRLRAKGAEVVQINHPLWAALGFLSTLGYDPAQPIQMAPNNFLLRESVLGTGTRNLDADSIEIMNGLSILDYKNGRDVWFSLLDQGHSMAATAASDSHRIGFATPPGLPRTYVRTSPDDPATFDISSFDAAVRGQHAIGTTGPFLSAELIGSGGNAGIGETLVAGSGTVQLHVKVQAPCWMPIGDLRVFANGSLLLQVPIDGTACTGALRYEHSFDVTPAVDTYFVVETEERFPRPSATFEQQLPTHVYKGAIYLGFTNPLYVDTDGNGVFDPPGYQN
jgi:hypothetical protein